MLVGVVGTGLIGASVALASKAAGYGTSGWDGNRAEAERAARLGALDAVAPGVDALLGEAETIVIATPLQATLALLRRFPDAPRARLVLDVASVKLPVVAAAAGVPNFVPSHPLAGSERSGADAARADLFSGCSWAYVAPADPALEGRARAFLGALGARCVEVDPARHDAIVAFTSHLPQLASTALGSMLERRLRDPLVRELCASGMRSMTRLASSSWSVWASVLDANAAPVAGELRALAGILQNIADQLESGADRELAERFVRAAAGAAGIRANVGPPS